MSMYNGTPQQFIDAYVECAVWASDDETPEWRDALLSELAREQIEIDCVAFYGKNWEDIGENLSQAGHDFFLTRCGHGAGFWDRPEVYGEEQTERLTRAAEECGEVWLYVGDDGLIYQA